MNSIAEDTRRIINDLKALDLSLCPYDKVKRLIKAIKTKIPCIVSRIPSNTVIMRIRRGHNLLKISELSYKPQERNNEYQRASTPNKTMFYGTISDDIMDSRFIAYNEISSIMRDNSHQQSEQITYGKWKVMKDIELISIVGQEVFPKANNLLLQEMKFNYQKLLSQDKDGNLSQIIEFFSSEFSKKKDLSLRLSYFCYIFRDCLL
jgi:hypothetical protein